MQMTPPLCQKVKSLNHVRLFANSWTYLAPQSMGFSRQEYWSEWPFPSPGALPDPGVKPASLIYPALAGTFFTTSATWSFCFFQNVVLLESYSV